MGTIIKPYTFSNGTDAEAPEVNANFDTIYNEFNGNIAAANIASNAITTAKVNDSAITTAKINDSAITTAKIADDAVTPAKWTNPYCFSAYRSGAHNATSTFTDLICNTEHYDYNDNYNATTGVYTAPVTGLYEFTASMDVSGTATVRALLQWATTGTTTAPTGQYPDYEVTRTRSVQITDQIRMEAGATIKVQKLSTTTSDTDSIRTRFSGYLICGV